MARDFAMYILRVILVIGICVIVGNTRCKSAGTTAVEQWQKTAETIEVLKSEPQTPATKRAIEVLTENQRALGDCSGKIADLELDTAEAQRDKWRWSAIAMAIGAALGFGGSLMIRR